MVRKFLRPGITLEATTADPDSPLFCEPFSPARSNPEERPVRPSLAERAVVLMLSQEFECQVVVGGQDEPYSMRTP